MRQEPIDAAAAIRIMLALATSGTHPYLVFLGEAQVARIAGVNIPNQKRVPIGLAYIHGIGRSTALKICTRVGIPPERRVSDLTDDEVSRVREVIDREFTVEGDLRRQVAMNIKRLMDLGCY